MGFVRWISRVGRIAVLGAVVMEAFAIPYAIVMGLMPDPPYDQVLPRITYSLFIACPLYLGVGLVWFFIAGAATRQEAPVVLAKSARTLALIVPLMVIVATVGGGIVGALTSQAQSGNGIVRPAWLDGAQMGLLASFPFALLVALGSTILSLRRESA